MMKSVERRFVTAGPEPLVEHGNMFDNNDDVHISWDVSQWKCVLRPALELSVNVSCRLNGGGWGRLIVWNPKQTSFTINVEFVFSGIPVGLTGLMNLATLGADQQSNLLFVNCNQDCSWVFLLLSFLSCNVEQWQFTN